MIEDALFGAFENQYNFERFSAEVYTALAVQLDFKNLTGLSAFMWKRAEEERAHAKKFADFLVDLNMNPKVAALPEPGFDITVFSIQEGAEKAFSLALEHERKVTARINDLVFLSVDDPACSEFLLWFVKEQVEEEKTLDEILTKFEVGRGNGAALLMLDKELR